MSYPVPEPAEGNSKSHFPSPRRLFVGEEGGVGRLLRFVPFDKLRDQARPICVNIF